MTANSERTLRMARSLAIAEKNPAGHAWRFHYSSGFQPRPRGKVDLVSETTGNGRQRLPKRIGSVPSLPELSGLFQPSPSAYALGYLMPPRRGVQRFNLRRFYSKLPDPFSVTPCLRGEEETLGNADPSRPAGRS